jgi:hypothetical protein
MLKICGGVFITNSLIGNPQIALEAPRSQKLNSPLSRGVITVAFQFGFKGVDGHFTVVTLTFGFSRIITMEEIG